MNENFSKYEKEVAYRKRFNFVGDQGLSNTDSGDVRAFVGVSNVNKDYSGGYRKWADSNFGAGFWTGISS